MKYVIIVIGITIFLMSSTSSQEKESPKQKSSGGAFVMDVIQVKGIIERPQAVFIINLSNPEYKGVTLDRKFVNNIKREDFKGLGIFSVDKKLAPEDLQKGQ